MHNHCCCSLVSLFPLCKCADAITWTSFLGLWVASTRFLQCPFSLFSRRLNLLSLPLCLAHMQGWRVWVSERWLICCTPHRRLAIFGLPGNPFFLRLCSGERQPATQGQHNELFSAFSFLLDYFSEHGPLIRVVCIIAGTNIGSRFTWIPQGLLHSAHILKSFDQLIWVGYTHMHKCSLSHTLKHMHNYSTCAPT